MGVVRQEPVIFDASIRDNIAYGYDGGNTNQCSNQLVVEAAKAANIHNFVISLPMVSLIIRLLKGGIMMIIGCKEICAYAF